MLTDTLPTCKFFSSTKCSSTIMKFFFRLLVLVLVYVFAGIAINKFALHKEGSDVIPQRTFWTDVPSLVKVCLLFK